jgi:hypothetical protein
VLPGARGGLATCDLPIGSFLGQPKCAQARCFGGFGLPLGLSGRTTVLCGFFAILNGSSARQRHCPPRSGGVTANHEMVIYQYSPLDSTSLQGDSRNVFKLGSQVSDNAEVYENNFKPSYFSKKNNCR